MNSVYAKTVDFLRRQKINRNCNKKIKTISKNLRLNGLTKDIESEYRVRWNKLYKKPSLLFLRCMCSISGIISGRYIPENIHYGFIEPVLNNRVYAFTYNDKNLFERYLFKHKYYFPDVILRGIGGVFYDSDYNYLTDTQVFKLLSNLQPKEQFIYKPAVETGGGSNVILLEKHQSGFLLSKNLYSINGFIDRLKNQYMGNFIIQYKINPHPWFRLFNSTSLNTVRLYTYRSVANETIHPLHAYIRFGKPGSLVDSSSQGGRTCGVSIDTGEINNFATGKYGERYEEHEFITGNNSAKTPYFDDMKRIAKEIAPYFNYHRLLGFDFSVDEDDRIYLLEVNNLYVGIINQQMNTGPLFREYTDEVIDYCLSHKKSGSFHYYL